MKKSFRQSMAWLHTWAGLTVGWVLYFIFLTGTFGYVSEEVDRWMRPEAPLVGTLPPAAEIVERAEGYLDTQAPNAPMWVIQLPGDRYKNELSAGWRASRPGGPGDFSWATLNPETGQPLVYESRATGGGYTLYWLHFSLHYVPRAIGTYIVGICAMFMFVAILTGIVTHRRIFTDFFTFRPDKGQRSWLDAHGVLAATALPFHLMITWSGLVFFLFTYMPFGMSAIYPDPVARAQFGREATATVNPAPETPLVPRPIDADAPPAPLAAIATKAEAQWGEGTIASIEVMSPHRANAQITVRARRSAAVLGRNLPVLRFTGAGDLVPTLQRTTLTAPGALQGVLLALHEANFARPWLRTLFLFAGVAGTVMVGTGLLLWSVKRKGKLEKNAALPANIVAIDAMNLGTILGLPIGIGVYFWANRLLPVEMDQRIPWEMNCLFIGWGVMLLYAFLRPKKRAWIEMPLIAAMIYAGIPFLNALTTDRHLGVTVPAGDWVLAGFDLSMFAVGAAFAMMGRTIWRVQARRETAEPTEVAPLREARAS
jgi:uncharacterized iron-regulated membrane protein